MVYLTRGISFWTDFGLGVISTAPVEPNCFAQSRWKLWVTLEGEPDPQTGMLMNVAQISRTVREVVAGYEFEDFSTGRFMSWCRSKLKEAFSGHRLMELRLEMNDEITMALTAGDEAMVELTIKYELAAAHCLTNPAWDASANRDAFGRCSNPAGHGHNYTLEITLRGKPDRATGQLMEMASINSIVKSRILDRFDHKYFNTDCEEFKDLLPTVENICRVFWELLEGRFGDVALARVRVWETANTYADYFGAGAGSLRDGEMV